MLYELDFFLAIAKERFLRILIMNHMPFMEFLTIFLCE